MTSLDVLISVLHFPQQTCLVISALVSYMALTVWGLLVCMATFTLVGSAKMARIKIFHSRATAPIHSVSAAAFEAAIASWVPVSRNLVSSRSTTETLTTAITTLTVLVASFEILVAAPVPLILSSKIILVALSASKARIAVAGLRLGPLIIPRLVKAGIVSTSALVAISLGAFPVAHDKNNDGFGFLRATLGVYERLEMSFKKNKAGSSTAFILSTTRKGIQMSRLEVFFES